MDKKGLSYAKLSESLDILTLKVPGGTRGASLLSYSQITPFKCLLRVSKHNVNSFLPVWNNRKNCKTHYSRER